MPVIGDDVPISFWIVYIPSSISSSPQVVMLRGRDSAWAVWTLNNMNPAMIAPRVKCLIFLSK